MKTRSKKGFTIVELVIVIAVVAILAAILVPVISNLVKRAHVSKDTQLVRNLNTALAMDTTTVKHETMQSALNAAAAYGYDVAKINASATDNMILWDSVNDVFCYYVQEEDAEPKIEYIPNSVKGEPLLADSYKLWIISDTVNPVYSTYYTGTATTINTSKGFDAGTSTTVGTINYTNAGAAQDVVIRTNGGTLNINAANDKVAHYGIANKVDIQAVASTSYVENGTVSIAKIKTGRIVITQQAILTSIHVVETNGGYDNIKVAVVGSAELPGFTRDDVTLNNGDKKLVIEVQSIVTVTAVDEEPEYIWISRNDDVTSTDIASSATTLNESTIVPTSSQSVAAKAVADDTENGTTAEQLEAMETVATRYAGGQGTQENPYLLATKTHFGSLDEDVHNGVTAGKHFKLVTDIDLGKIYPIGSMGLVGNNGAASQSYTITYSIGFEGVFDGDHHSITYKCYQDDGLNNSNTIGLFGCINFATVKNLTVNADVISTSVSIWGGGLAGFGFGSDLENVTVNGNIECGHDVGGFFGYFSCDSSEENHFRDCVSNINVVSKSKRAQNYAMVGGFIGQYSPDTTDGSTLSFINCESNGNLSIATGTTCSWGSISRFIAFGSDNAADAGKEIIIIFKDCSYKEDAEISSVLGNTRVAGVYCAPIGDASSHTLINYLGITSNKSSTSYTSSYKVYINNVLQDMTSYNA